MSGFGNGVKKQNQTHAGFLIPAGVTITTLLVLILYIFGFAADRGDAYGENTTGTYSQPNGDTIQFCTTNQCSGVGNRFTNTFAPGARVYVKVHTTRFSGGTGYLYLYSSNTNAVPPASGYRSRNLVWTQVGSDYYSYVTIPGAQNIHMRLYGQIVNGGNQVKFEDEIELTTQTARFMNYYWTGPQSYPPSPAAESYTYRSGATVYVMGYGTAGNNNATYSTNSLKDIVTGSSTALTIAGYSRVSTYYHRYTLALPASGLTDGQWYSINSRLMSSSTAMIFNMSRMILIDDSPPDASIDAPSASSYVKGNIPVTGTASDASSYYKYLLEYGAGASPSSWTTIVTQTNMPPVLAGNLGDWDTSSLNGLYTLRLTVTDRAGNPGNQTVVTRQVNVDNAPPVITGVGASPIGGSAATINWTTDEVADSQVTYGTEPGNYTNSTTLDPADVTAHSQPLSGLQSSTTYYYRVVSTDRAGNVTTSPEYSFLTANITILQPYPSLGKDTEYQSRQPAWDWGGAIWLLAGDFNTPDYGTSRSVLRFDLSGIPASATISSANMSLYQQFQADSSTPTINAHYLTRDWNEGSGAGLGTITNDGANWNTYNGVNPWTTAGGDYYSTAPSGSSVAPNAINTWVGWNLTGLTQSWVTGGIPNYGVLLKQDAENPAGMDAKGYWSSDYQTDPSLRPKLTIEWFGTDTAAPNIGEARAENVTRTSADIKWSTDEQADSQVEYGTTTNYGSLVPGSPDPSLVNQHSVALSGLTDDLIYHYRVISRDQFGNRRESGDYVFQTARLITIQPDAVAGQDAWISSAGATLNYGAATDIAVGNNAATPDTRRGLLKFNLASIPMGSTINSATLSLYQHAQASNSTPALGVYYLQRSWTEGSGDGTATGNGATWGSYDGFHPWGAPGGDVNATVQANATAPDSTAAWVDFTISSLVQNWVNGAFPNEGLAIRKILESTGLTDYKSFYSSDYAADPSLRPKLVIEYVPAPGSMAITVDETYNRDATPGSGSVSFGNVNPTSSYDVGDSGSPPYAVRLTIKSSGMWGLSVAASGDLEQSNPANAIAISNLTWKEDQELPAMYRPMTKTPAETAITSGQAATNGVSFMFDYRLAVPSLATSGGYSVPIIYTAYPE